MVSMERNRFACYNYDDTLCNTWRKCNMAKWKFIESPERVCVCVCVGENNRGDFISWHASMHITQVSATTSLEIQTSRLRNIINAIRLIKIEKESKLFACANEHVWWCSNSHCNVFEMPEQLFFFSRIPSRKYI